MSVKKHLTSDEELLDYCTTDRWAWVCTDQRILKYRSDSRGEQLDDISLDEITGISLTSLGKKDTLLGYAILSGIGTVVLVWLSLGSLPYPASGLSAVAAVVPYLFYRRYKQSADAYFELRGTGLIQQEPEKWRIRSGGDSEEVESFVRTIRENI